MVLDLVLNQASGSAIAHGPILSVKVCMENKPLLIEETDRERVGIDGLLTCGHYAGPFYETSSVWDHPDRALVCPNGCGERQFNLRLQLHLMELKAERMTPYDWATDDDWRQ